jgi:LysM repeat protein
MSYRSPGRLLAPLALIAAVIALVAVISSAGDGDPAPASQVAPPASVTDDGGSSGTRTTARSEPARYYTVRSGDILSVIAERTGVSLETILDLNPGIDPQTLAAGQRIRLRQ